MAARYSQCPDPVTELARQVLKEHHQELHTHGVTIDYIFAYAAKNEQGEKVGVAIKHHGHGASGLAKIVGLKDRVMGRADAEILLDGDSWPEMSLEHKKALLDHEQTHFEVARDVEGGLLRDTAGRPKLKMRLHDREFGWFDECVMRHGANSLEYFQAAQFFVDAGQLYFPFAKATKAVKGKAKKPELPES